MLLHCVETARGCAAVVFAAGCEALGTAASGSWAERPGPEVRAGVGCVPVPPFLRPGLLRHLAPILTYFSPVP